MSTRRSSRRRVVIPIEPPEKKAKTTDAEDSEAFWSHEAFAEDEDDESFDENEMSDKGEDIVDSDFDEPEDVPAEDAGEAAEKEMRAEERRNSRKSRMGKYVDPAAKSKRNTAGPAAPKASAQTGKQSKAVESENLNVDRSSLRKSTKVASALAAKEREKRQLDDEQKRRRKALRNANKPEVRVPTQKELLAEAEETEVKNRDSLKDLLRLEEEKKRLPPPKKEAEGPRISHRSRDGKQTVSFSSKDADAREVMFPHMYST